MTLNKEAIIKSGGTYILLLKLIAPRKIRVGALGKYSFEEGFYVYVGSALGPGGLKARLTHHINSSPNPRWHIDYLKSSAMMEEIWISICKKRQECLWSVRLREMIEMFQPARDFGSSDCDCISHLFFMRKKPDFSSISRKLAKNIKMITRSEFKEFILEA